MAGVICCGNIGQHSKTGKLEHLKISHKCNTFQKSGPSIDIRICANQKQIKLFLKYLKKYQLNQILYHNTEMVHLLLEPFTLKIYQIFNKLLGFKVENSSKSVPSIDNHFYAKEGVNLVGF